MADWQTDARRAAIRAGYPDPDAFVRQMGQEAHGADLTSGAGAEGPAQFEPATARSVGLNSTTVHQRVPAYDAAAKLMTSYVHQYGSVKNALVAYNAGPGAVGRPLPAETQGYLKTILGGSGGGGQASQSASSSAAASQDASAAPAASSDSSSSDPSAMVALLTALQGQKKVVPSSGGLAAPAFSASPALPKGYAALASGGGPQQSQTPDLGALLSLVQSSSGGDSAPAAATSAPAAALPASAPAAQGSSKVVQFDGKPVAGWIAPILQYARSQGWQGSVSSGYRTDAEQTKIYNSGVRPAAVPKSEGGSGSNHEGAVYPLGAIDVTDPQGLAKIIAGSPYAKKLIYAGAKDPVHFSHPHGGGY